MKRLIVIGLSSIFAIIAIFIVEVIMIIPALVLFVGDVCYNVKMIVQEKGEGYGSKKESCN